MAKRSFNQKKTRYFAVLFSLKRNLIANVGGCSFVVCLSYLTIYRSSLSRRSTFPFPHNRHLQHLGTRYAFPIYYLYVRENCLLIVSSSCFAVRDHHASPRTATVFSLLSSLPNSSMSHSSNFLISANTSRER